MSGSVGEVQDLADQILALLGVQIRSGELVVRYADGPGSDCAALRWIGLQGRSSRRTGRRITLEFR
jgi:hypothetical protein